MLLLFFSSAYLNIQTLLPLSCGGTAAKYIHERKGESTAQTLTEENLMTNTYELKTVYDARASFYGKAKVEVKDDGTKVLRSYGLPIAAVKKGTPYRTTDSISDLTATTMRHVREFFRQEGWLYGSQSLSREEFMQYPYTEA